MDAVHILLLNTPWVGVLVFVFASVLSALALYSVSRILFKPRAGVDSELLSARVIVRLGALHALILALMFAHEMADYQDVYRVVSYEVSAIIDVDFNLQEYDKENLRTTAAIRDSLVEFVKTLNELDRATLAEHRMSEKTLINYRRINRQLRSLQPTNNEQEELRAQMVANWSEVLAVLVRIRSIAEHEAPAFFWVVVIVGFVAVVIPFYIYSPSLANLVMLSIYAAFNGLVMYVIFAIANPFAGALAVHTEILQRALSIMVSPAL